MTFVNTCGKKKFRKSNLNSCLCVHMPIFRTGLSKTDVLLATTQTVTYTNTQSIFSNVSPYSRGNNNFYLSYSTKIEISNKISVNFVHILISHIFINIKQKSEIISKLFIN